MTRTRPFARSTRPARSLKAVWLAMVAALLATAPTTAVAAQLVTSAGSMEACEVLRLGDRLDAPDWLQFRGPPGLTLGPEGRVYMTPGDAIVRVLDADGNLVRTIGGQGEGPGEFVSIGGIGFVGDTLWAQNWPVLNTSFFDSEGTHLKTEADRGPPSAGPHLWRTSLPLAGGQGFYVPATGEISKPRVLLPMMVGPRSDASRDTLAFRFSETNMSISGVGSFYYYTTTIPPLHRLDPAGRGIVVAEWDADLPEAVVIRHFDEYGRPTRESRIEAELRPIPRNVRRGFIEEGMRKAEGPYESARQMGQQVAGSLREAVEEGLILPDHYAPIESFLVTRAGRVWLRQTTVEEGDEVRWVVLGPDGEPEFRVSAPEGVVFRAPDGHRVWATATTEMDVPFIVLYELVRPGECG